ncbi:hypothetical protein KSP39_PZI021238 [Platanthera zijinensis]|uniref:rRNA methylase YtqB n=1 Tax=Platanthera zijinensis TaxID=2320716 RepID=A0AAP0AXD6_9ASPA
MKTITLTLIHALRPSPRIRRPFYSPRASPLLRCFSGCHFLPSATGEAGAAADGVEDPSLKILVKRFPVAGAEDALLDFIAGKRKATEVAHLIWKNIILRGDTVVDATCGNGYDTMALLKLIADGSTRGRVYGLDIQKSALENTSYLLRESVDEDRWDLVKLSLLCHSRMEDIVPKDIPVRLIAFNLGYLPGGNKTIITKPHTTMSALQAASRLLMSGGLISVVVYVGHSGGREEFETVLSFASGLSVESWSSFKFETVSRPSGPALVFILKK